MQQKESAIEELYSRRKTADMFGVSENTVSRLVAANKLHAIKIGRQIRVPASAIKAFLENSAVAAA